MLKIENVEVYGWEAAIRGMRNPMNSWQKSDSDWCRGGDRFEDCTISTYGQCPRQSDCFVDDVYCIGENDMKLMQKLYKGGTEHRKYLRMIAVTMDITAPLYWWKEFDTYKVGTVANSCSTMHKIHERPFVLDDFSWDHLLNTGCNLFGVEKEKGLFLTLVQPLQFLTDYIIPSLNMCRSLYIETKDKAYWWQMIQLLPTSYNQKRTVMMNYEVCANIVRQRRNHKLDEWHILCDEIRKLPYFAEITEE